MILVKTMEKDNKNTPDQRDLANVESNRYNLRLNPGALKCELELIPVIAGECRAEPTSITTVERSLIRSSSAEVKRKLVLKMENI